MGHFLDIPIKEKISFIRKKNLKDGAGISTVKLWVYIGNR